jgi:molybdenum cofactor cytidylyltransferase
MRVLGCILSAGLSRRMGSPKALLTIEGETFLERIVRLMREAGISDIWVVYHQKEIREKGPEGINWIYNGEPEKGQLHSLRLFVKTILEKDSPGFVMTPVDHPLVTVKTYQKLVEKVGLGKILIPTYKKRRGHPTFFPKSTYRDLLDAPLEIGARYVIRKRKELVLEIPVDDPGILVDIDTPQDLEEIIKRGGIGEG